MSLAVMKWMMVAIVMMKMIKMDNDYGHDNEHDNVFIENELT